MNRRSFLALMSALPAASAGAARQTGGSFVQVSKRNSRYLEAVGRSYIPIGLNLIYPPWPSAQPTPDERLAELDRWLARLAANGGNYIRIWLGDEFYDLEPQAEGNFDETHALRVERALVSCKRHNVRAKLTIEHFRSIGGGSQSWADRPIHNKLHRGSATTVAEWLAGETSRAAFRRKLEWLAKRFGARPEIYGWELWNEINAVQSGDYLAWTRAMLPELHRLFPENLALQSLGSFDGDYARKEYAALSTMPGEDVAQLHRYLDPGARLPVCHGPMDILAADAVRELLAMTPDRPVVLAESGAVEANHAGPSKLYAKDTLGTLLHDVLFAPFFAGAAGPGHIWHWDHYVEKNNIWWQFGRFSRAIAGFDPVSEAPQPEFAEAHGCRIYTLRGRRTSLIWLRDSASSWREELQDGQVPAPVHGVSLALTGRTARAYDPWADRWTPLTVQSGRAALPDFTRSLVVRATNS